CYDLDYPPPIRWKRPIPDAFGIGLVLSHGERLARRDNGDQHALARVSVSFAAVPATLMTSSALETLRQHIPAARGLPLPDCLAQRRSAAVALDYLDAQRLRVEVET